MFKLLDLDTYRARLRAGSTLDGVVRAQIGDPQPVEGAERTVRFCFSDGSVDRSGDTIEPAGWDLTSFKANSVALWAHDSSAPPIGRAANVKVEGKRLMGDIEFADAETYAFADTVFRLVKGKFLNAVSVGFMPLEWKWSADQERPYGIDFKRQELLEISVCPVPCNSNALAEARGIGIDTAPLIGWAERLLDGEARASIAKAELERIRREADPAQCVTIAVPPAVDGEPSEPVDTAAAAAALRRRRAKLLALQTAL